MIPLLQVIILAFTLGSIAALQADEALVDVVPYPRRVELTGTGCLIDDATMLVIDPQCTAHERFAVSAMQQVLAARRNINLRITEGGTSGTPVILIGNPRRDRAVADRMERMGLSITPAMEAEGYVLGVDERGVVIGAVSEPGLLYGTMTLRQLLTANQNTNLLPGIRIHDWPEFEIRGIQDEISYGQVSTMDNFKEIIRFLAEHKMNTMFIYIEDMFRFESYPTIGIGRGALTREQVDELETYAAPYHVELIPDFETLGNQGALLMLDEIRPLAEFPGAHSFAVSEETYEFLDNCIREMAAAFDSKYFHAGLDESWDLGFGRTEELINRLGRGVVHVNHYKRVNDILKKYGKTMIMYSDILLKYPEGMDNLPRDIIQMDWQHGLEPARIESMAGFLNGGFTHITSSALRNHHYFFPRNDEGFAKSKRVVEGSLAHKRKTGQVLGSMVASWGDEGSRNFRALNPYGQAYFNELLWSPEHADVVDFGHRFFTQRYGPGAGPVLQTIYNLLERWPENWHRSLLDTFRHPFDARRKSHVPTYQEFEWVQNNALNAIALLEQVRPLVRFRQGDMDYLDYVARSHLHYVRSQRLVQTLQQFDASTLSDAELRQAQAEFLQEAREIKNQMAALRDRFQELWLRTNIPANLHYAIDDYNKVIKTWEQAEARILQGQFAYDPLTPARFIYHPDGFEKKAQISHAWFRKTFGKPAELRSAHFQVYGDTWIKIYINGTQIGEQFVRRNLSAPVNPRLIQLYDIAPLLRDGANVIAVEAHKFNPKYQNGPDRCGGFYLYGEIVDGAGNVQQILSDESWLVSGKETAGWNTIDFPARGWKNARILKKPEIALTYPDFADGFKGYAEPR